MSRWFTVSLLSATLSGCIIYEQRYVPIECEGECAETTEPGRPGPEPTEPTETEPAVTNGVRLTTNEAYPGDVLLSFLVPNEEGVDIATVETLSFERDITVLDSERRQSEIVLLLSVAEAATPGDVEVFITTTGGGGWILAEPFHILGASTTGTTGTEDTGTDGTTTDTGSATP